MSKKVFFIALLTFICQNYSAALSFAFAAVCFIYLKLFGIKKTNPIEQWIVLSCIVIQLIGWATSSSDVGLFERLKDSWYFWAPFLYILLGIEIHKNRFERDEVMRGALIGTLYYAFEQIFLVARDPSVLQLTAADLRGVVGLGNYATALVFWSSLYFSSRSIAHRSTYNALAALGFVGVLLTASRGIVLTAFIGLFCFIGLFQKAFLKKLLFTILFSLVIIFVLRSTLPLEDPEVSSSFVGKIALILDEGSIRNDLTEKEINDNWRGYEAAMALDQYSRYNIYGLAFGGGFGELIDMGIYIGNGDDREDKVRFIPILHNGYAYALVKVGLFGFMAFFLPHIFIFSQITKYSYTVYIDPTDRSIAIALYLCMFLATWSVAGFFNKSAVVFFMVLLGYFVSRISSREL